MIAPTMAMVAIMQWMGIMASSKHNDNSSINAVDGDHQCAGLDGDISINNSGIDNGGDSFGALDGNNGISDGDNWQDDGALDGGYGINDVRFIRCTGWRN